MNLRPLDPQSSALPPALHPELLNFFIICLLQANCVVYRCASVRNIRTRPTCQIKDLELVPGTLAFATPCVARQMSPCSLGALRNSPCFFPSVASLFLPQEAVGSSPTCATPRIVKLFYIFAYYKLIMLSCIMLGSICA